MLKGWFTVLALHWRAGVALIVELCLKAAMQDWSVRCWVWKQRSAFRSDISSAAAKHVTEWTTSIITKTVTVHHLHPHLLHQQPQSQLRHTQTSQVGACVWKRRLEPGSERGGVCLVRPVFGHAWLMAGLLQPLSLTLLLLSETLSRALIQIPVLLKNIDKMRIKCWFLYTYKTIHKVKGLKVSLYSGVKTKKKWGRGWDVWKVQQMQQSVNMTQTLLTSFSKNYQNHLDDFPVTACKNRKNHCWTFRWSVNVPDVL